MLGKEPDDILYEFKNAPSSQGSNLIGGYGSRYGDNNDEDEARSQDVFDNGFGGIAGVRGGGGGDELVGRQRGSLATKLPSYLKAASSLMKQGQETHDTKRDGGPEKGLKLETIARAMTGATWRAPMMDRGRRALISGPAPDPS